MLSNFSGKCAITGLSLPVVQACHIESFSIGRDHSTDNGIALEPTLHALFDKGLSGIHPEDLTVHFAVDCFYKDLFEGKEIRSLIPLNKEKLITKWEGFKK